MNGPSSVQAVLTDIEGTTTSLSFVRDTLFPYARRHLLDYVRSHRDDPRVKAIFEDIRIGELRPSLGEDAIIALLHRWIDDDRKITPLKTLQGYVWEEGYRSRVLSGHVYDDAVVQLRAWNARGLRLYVYSSGSVAAQKLLFGSTPHGDLTRQFAGFFDTAVGSKREVESYVAIASAIGTPACKILFLSDTLQELDAARAAGMATTWLNRDAQPASGIGHPHACTFDDIDPFRHNQDHVDEQGPPSSRPSTEPEVS